MVQFYTNTFSFFALILWLNFKREKTQYILFTWKFTYFTWSLLLWLRERSFTTKTPHDDLNQHQNFSFYNSLRNNFQVIDHQVPWRYLCILYILARFHFWGLSNPVVFSFIFSVACRMFSIDKRIRAVCGFWYSHPGSRSPGYVGESLNHPQKHPSWISST